MTGIMRTRPSGGMGADFDAVLERARAGERAAFERIYRDVAPLVTGYLRSLRVDDPEDVAGDVFVDLVRGLDRFSGDERQFRSWLLTIAHRRAMDAGRRKAARPAVPVPPDELSPTVVAHAAEEDSLQRLRAEGIVDAIDRLSEHQRAAVMLRVLADLTVPEVARVMGKPETAVKALLRRATVQLSKSVPDR